MTRKMLVPLAVLAALSLSVINQAAAASRAEVQNMVVVLAKHTRVPPSLALAVAKVESDFQDDLQGKAGERGVMQILPKTAMNLWGVRADSLDNPRTNIQLGLDFLDRLLERYEGRFDLALSHYNGGSRVGKMPNARVIPSTRDYVDKVLTWEKHFRGQEESLLAANHAPTAEERPAISVIGTQRFPESIKPETGPEPSAQASLQQTRELAQELWGDNPDQTGFTRRLEGHYAGTEEAFNHKGYLSPSARFRGKMNTLRQKFRHYLNNHDRRWQGYSDM
ncbi:Lytic transglycosylase, catalytic [Magnetococcus marinus MC-1]|uniref:Lytic transglycosylase, catalytic n=1 Tax=Magnetococcus marinus (strain ATCC BAA-1437 / JCM 17883 / MC-1) TaxID=156889 RepID=A0L965_MAGMM|nr:lytic transglycosylase domain-containing protein [Magnetococcus marinus]ABK44508.1 Lytic transglycosylase, catalytic [Magnetococcus marinus MC-1]